MIEVIWVGPEKIIPGYGVGQNGEPILLPDDLADKLKNQGMVKEKNAKPKQLDKGE